MNSSGHSDKCFLLPQNQGRGKSLSLLLLIHSFFLLPSWLSSFLDSFRLSCYPSSNLSPLLDFISLKCTRQIWVDNQYEVQNYTNLFFPLWTSASQQKIFQNRRGSSEESNPDLLLPTCRSPRPPCLQILLLYSDKVVCIQLQTSF